MLWGQRLLWLWFDLLWGWMYFELRCYCRVWKTCQSSGHRMSAEYLLQPVRIRKLLTCGNLWVLQPIPDLTQCGTTELFCTSTFYASVPSCPWAYHKLQQTDVRATVCSIHHLPAEALRLRSFRIKWSDIMSHGVLGRNAIRLLQLICRWMPWHSQWTSKNAILGANPYKLTV